MYKSTIYEPVITEFGHYTFTNLVRKSIMYLALHSKSE